MPFGPYNSFTDCVQQNQDKSAPEGFCAWLHHKILGTWPSQLQLSMPEEAWVVYRDAYGAFLDRSSKPVVEAESEANTHALAEVKKAGWLYSRIGWVKEYAVPKMRTVSGVRIFSSGTWTDSSGVTREWTDEEIDELVRAFNMGVPAVVPLKAGHTPDSFNQSLAEKLDVPVDVVIGDHGKGQISIGRMSTLERRGSLLFASFERVPDSIAELIEMGLYSTVSVEIEDNIGDYASAITAVALLGAEEPAVDVATLDRALVFGGKRENAHVLTFDKTDYLEREFSTLYTRMSETIKGMRGAPVFRALMQNLRTLFDQITKKGHHESPPITHKEDTMGKSIRELKAHRMQEPDAPPAPEAPETEVVEDEVVTALVAIAHALGLSEEASIEDILAAIEQLKGGAAPEGEGGPVEAQYQKVRSELQKANDKISGLERKDRIHGYLEQVRLFTAVPRKPEDMAVELADLEEKAGKAVADGLLRTYQQLNTAGEAAMKVTGTSISKKDDSAFEAKVKAYAKENSLTFEAALSYFSKTDRAGFREYQRDNLSPRDGKED